MSEFSLRSLLADYQWTNLLHETPRIKTAVVAEEIQKLFGSIDARPLSPEEIGDMYADINQRLSSGEPLGQWPIRLLKRAPWVLFYPPNREAGWLAGDEKFTAAYLTWLSEKRQPVAVSTLVTSLLKDYPVEWPGFDAWMEFARRILGIADSVRLEKWKGLCEAGGLLDRDGPQRLAAKFRASDLSAEEFLDAWGFGGFLSDSRLLVHFSRSILKLEAEAIASGKIEMARFERDLDFLSDGGALRFPELRVDVCENLLRPCLKSPPSQELQEGIQHFLLEKVGNPRWDTAAWQGVSRESMGVLLKWLVAATLDEFFTIFDKSSNDRMWEPRKEFWKTYLEKGVIQDATVIFGPRARTLARRYLKSEGRGAASLVNPYDKSHSVLLMKIGGLTIAEWSHNGKCRFWKAGNEYAPNMREFRFKRAELDDTTADEMIIHDPASRWKEKCARIITAETGVPATVELRRPNPQSRRGWSSRRRRRW